MGQHAIAMCTISGNMDYAVTLMTTRVGEVQTAAVVTTALTGMATLVFQVREDILEDFLSIPMLCRYWYLLLRIDTCGSTRAVELVSLQHMLVAKCCVYSF
jgi:hypothetical protein